MSFCRSLVAIAAELVVWSHNARKGDVIMCSIKSAGSVVRKLICVWGFILLLVVSASAQDEKAKGMPEGASSIEAFAGISVLHLSKSFVPTSPTTMYGGILSAAYYPSSWFGVVAEYDANMRGGATGQTLLLGPRVAFHRDGRISPFGQVLFGFVWSNGNLNGLASQETTEMNIENFAASVGGGLDVKVSRHIALRLAKVDYLLLHQPAAGFVNTYSRNCFRYSTGVVFRFFGPKSARE